MKILLVDDEDIALRLLSEVVGNVAPEAELFPFRKCDDALDFAGRNEIDVAFLDIMLKGSSGVSLAEQIKKANSKCNIIFVTAYSDYTLQAMNMHASGYITKPVTEEKVRRELYDLRNPIENDSRRLLKIKCFGNFEAFDDKEIPIHFERSKSKEILAYLVNLAGSSATIREIAAALFEDESFDKKQLNYVQQAISSLIKTLRSEGYENAINRGFNSYAILPEMCDCDYYRLRNKDFTVLSQYNGTYMQQYYWAEETTGYIDSMIEKYNFEKEK